MSERATSPFLNMFFTQLFSPLLKQNVQQQRELQRLQNKTRSYAVTSPTVTLLQVRSLHIIVRLLPKIVRSLHKIVRSLHVVS